METDSAVEYLISNPIIEQANKTIACCDLDPQPTIDCETRRGKAALIESISETGKPAP